MTRRRALWLAGAAVAGAAALAAAGLAAVALAERRPDAAMEIWRTADRVRLGARSGEVALESGERVAYAALGPRSGRPIVVVHGLRGEATVMLPLGRALADHGLRVVALDFPGHGRSSPPGPELSIGRASEIVLETIEKAALGPRPVLLGHSMGGWVVAWTALEAPERCGPVVLVGSGGLVFEPPPYHLLMPDDAEDARRSLPLLFAHPPDPPRFVLEVASSRPMEASLDLLRSGLSGRYLLEGLIQGLDVPALVVWGADDRIIPPESGRRLADAVPDGTWVLLDDASHMVVWERPEAVADAVARFLAGLETSPSG